MEWVPSSMWLTYLQLNAQAGDLDYDLALSAHPSQLPTLKDAGVDAKQAQVVSSGEWTGVVAGRGRCPRSQCDGDRARRRGRAQA